MKLEILLAIVLVFLGLVFFSYPPLLEKIKKHYRILYNILASVTFLFGIFSALTIYLVSAMGGTPVGSSLLSNAVGLLFFGTPLLWGGVCYLGRFIQHLYGIRNSSSYFIPATLLYVFIWFLLSSLIVFLLSH